MFLSDDFIWCLSAALHMLKLFDNTRIPGYFARKIQKSKDFQQCLIRETKRQIDFLWNWTLKIEKQALVFLSVLMIKQVIEIVNIFFIFEISTRSPLYETTTKWTHFKTHLSLLEYSLPFRSITTHAVIYDKSSLWHWKTYVPSNSYSKTVTS